MAEQQQKRFHALLLPFPAQGHINPFMQLAQILMRRNLYITFVNTDVNHRVLKPESTEDIRFVSFPDGLPQEHRRLHNLPDFCERFLQAAATPVEEIVQQAVPPVDMLICDTMYLFAQDVANRHGIPLVLFRTTSACGYSAYCNTSQLLRNGYLPLPLEAGSREATMEESIGCIPGLESLRVKDLPTFLQTSDELDFFLRFFVESEKRMAHGRPSLVLINTWQELEAPLLHRLELQLGVKLAAIGPMLLHEDPQQQQNSYPTDQKSGSLSLWKEDKECMEWLDRQQPGTVLYVSLGSMAALTREQMQELAWGLEASGHPFLWVLRPDLVQGGQSKTALALPPDFVRETTARGRACFVRWAPQWQVLRHQAVAAFLSHCGWNSALESLCAGVPMLCWSVLAEQPTNRRFIAHVWKAGLDMVDGQDVRRERVAALVKQVMDPCHPQTLLARSNVAHLSRTAYAAVSQGGSSRANLELLFDIVETHARTP